MRNGTIPEEVIRAVLKHHDIVDVVSKYVHLTKHGKYMKGLCPFHSEKTPSFTVTPEKQIFYCYGCGAGGHAIKFVMEMEGYTFPEAVRHMAEEANIAFRWNESAEEQTAEQMERAELLKAHELSAKWFHYLLKNTDYGKPAMNYLKSRGFTDKLIDAFQIGYAPPTWDTLAQFLDKREFSMPLMERGGLISARNDGSGYVDRFRNRIMFPICDAKGRVVAFAGRVLDDGQPKYLNSPETMLFNKSRSLYNYHQARAAIRKTRKIVLFEGYVDVIKAWEAGVENGVATMGTSLTEQHAELMKRNADEIVVCYDGDNAGQSAARKSLDILERAGCRVSVAIIPHKMDPDEYISANGAERFVRDVVEQAVPAVKFKLVYLSKNFAMNESDGKLRYIHEALKVIAGLPSPTEREHYLKELSSETDYSLDALKQELYQIRQHMQKIRRTGDNKEIPWNNVMNDGKAYVPAPALLPAYHNAERNLLAGMMHSREIALYVEQQLGGQFNVDVHAALAAYLYAFYAEGNEPDVSTFISTLQNGRLESVASSISLLDPDPAMDKRVIDDYIREIKKYPRQMEIERKKEEIVRAERSGDVLHAAQIASEIIALERQLKAL